jgi:beta-lactamase regulating signal transducer with metallopeptidase domain
MIALLLNHLWQSSLCVGGAGLLVLALHRNSANVRFWLWFTASVKFLVPFAALTALSAYVLTPMVPPVAAPRVMLAEPLAKPFSAPAIALVTTRLTAEPSVQPASAGRRISLTRPSLPKRLVPPASYTPHFDLKSTLLALWATGFLILATWWLIRWARVRVLLREATEVQVDAPIAVKFSASRLEPGLVGILHPVILLPHGIEQQLTPAELKAVLTHELCHWRRRDNLLGAIHMLVEALFWFFPLVWWLRLRLDTERERACDEAVLAEGNDPQMYAEGILKVCRVYLQSPLACVAGVSGADLKKRIEAIMENRLVLQLNAARKFVLSTSAAIALGVPLALGIMGVPVTQMQAKAAPIPAPPKNAQQALISTPEFSTTALPINQAAIIEDTATSRTERLVLLPDLSRLLPTQSLTTPAPIVSNDRPTVQAQAASSTSPAQRVAFNDQSGTLDAIGTTGINTSACAAPTLIGSLPMDEVADSNTMTVTATVEGRPERLLIGIGDLSTQLWNAEAAKLKLPVQEGVRAMDFGGRYSQSVARVARFTLGAMETGGFYVQIMPDPDYAMGTDGVLATDMMHSHDIDLDFAHRQMNYFSPEQCKGAGIYWSPSTVASVQMETHPGVIYVPVTLNGHTIMALLDTGADRTFLNPRVAEKLFGLKAGALEEGTIKDGGALIKAGMHTFSSLTFGGLTLNNPQIAIPLDVETQNTHDSHAAKIIRNQYHLSEILPPMIIGMDVLKQSHLYISFQNERVYVSAAGDGQALKQQAPAKPSWFNVWRDRSDPMFQYLHPFVAL